MGFDAASGMVVLAGGNTDLGQAVDTWTWDGTQWTESAATTGGYAMWSATASDPVRGTVVTFGGSGSKQAAVNTTEVWSQGTWSTGILTGAPLP
jgi:hypothetical protein